MSVYAAGSFRSRTPIMKKSAVVAVMLLGLFCSACHSPLAYTDAGTYETHRGRKTGSKRDGVLKQIALFIPNRIVDAVDMVHAGLALGLGLGLDVRVTRWGQLAASADVGAGLQWDGRGHSPAVYDAQVTGALGPWRGGAGSGEVASIRDFEVGFGFGGTKLAIDLAEVADFALGWFFIDILEDDYGRR